MILDRLDNAKRCAGYHAGLARGLEWLTTHDVTQLPAGKHPIDGAGLYATVVRDTGRGQSRARLETHQRYLDIQYTVSGEDLIGWRHAGACTAGTGYDAERDVELFDTAPEAWVRVPTGHFAVFFPEDAHAPLGTDGAVHKVVVKVAV